MSVRKKLPSRFTKDGLLPVGDYELTPDELRSSMLVHGPSGKQSSKHWHADWRSQMTENAIAVVEQLWRVGPRPVWIGGSYVEDCNEPGDVDAYFECDVADIVTGELAARLNVMGPYRYWSWDWKSRVSVPGYVEPKLRMWRDLRVEIYPHYGQRSGITDQFGNPLTFPAAFRKSRDFHPKGIIKLVAEHDSN